MLLLLLVSSTVTPVLPEVSIRDLSSSFQEYTANVTILDKTLSEIGSIKEFSSVRREYAVNRSGGCDIVIPRDSIFIDESLIASDKIKGNWVVIESDSGVPDWLGYISGAAGSRSSGTVTIRCKDIAGLLGKTPTDWQTYQIASGEIVKLILIEASKSYDIRTSPASIYPGGQVIDFSTTGQTIQSAFDELSRISGCTWELSYDANTVQAYLNWREPFYVFDKSNVTLTDSYGGAIIDADWDVDYDAAIESLTIQGPLDEESRRPRVVLKAGMRTALGDAVDENVSSTRSEGEVRYGLRGQYRIVNLKTSDRTTLESQGASMLKLRLAPWRSIALKLRAHPIWSEIVLGGVYHIHFDNYFNTEFDGLVRVVSFAPDEKAGIMEVACHVWRLMEI